MKPGRNNWIRRVGLALRWIRNYIGVPSKTLASKRRGGIARRIEDLSELWPLIRGAAIVDVGCFDGLLAYECVRRGALNVVGVDNDAYHLSTARRIFDQVEGAENKFVRRDVTSASFPEELQSLCRDARCDVLLFLGVYQHVYEAMSIESRAKLICALFSEQVRIVAVRMPEWCWPLFVCHLPKDVEEVLSKPDVGNVGGLRIYKRNV